MGFDNVVRVHTVRTGGGEIGAMRTALQLHRLTGRLGADLVVFNTAHGAVVRDFTLLPQGRRRLAGVVHNILKLDASTGQKIITRRMRRYLVLNDYLLDNRQDKLDVVLDWFYPIFFPPFTPVDVTKGDKEIWACIPGKVDFKRRDYEGLLMALGRVDLPANLRILFLGSFENDATQERVEGLVAATGSPDRFKFFEGFTDHGAYQSHLAASNLILPLLHPGTERFHEYSGVQISGAFNLAFSHKVPLLMERSFARYAAFEGNSIFYDLEDLAPTLGRLASDPAEAHARTSAMREDPRYTFEFQRDRYLQVVAR